MRFLHPERDEQLELALEDVFLLPNRFEGGSRLDVDLTPSDFPGGAHPVVTANMNAVTGKRMAETVARFGGLGVLPQDMGLETVERILAHIKGADPRYDTPLFVSPDATLRDVEGIIRKRAHSMVVVVDDDHRPIGIVTPTDLRDRDQYSFVRSFMHEQPVTTKVGTSNRDAFLAMDRERVRAMPVLDDDGRLYGILTRDDAVRLELLKASSNPKGELMVAAAVGISAEAKARAVRLRELGVDVLVLDTAHGHQRRMIENAPRGPRGGPGPPARGGQRLHAGGDARADRRGRRRGEGQRGAGRDVHDAHADRRRAPDLQLRARLRGGGAGAGASTSGPTAA